MSDTPPIPAEGRVRPFGSGDAVVTAVDGLVLRTLAGLAAATRVG